MVEGDRGLNSAQRIAAVALGAAVPALVSGRVTMALVLILALGCAAASHGVAPIARAAWSFLRSGLGLALGALFLVWLGAVIGSVDPWGSIQVWGRMVAFVPLGSALVAWLLMVPAAHALALRSLAVTSLVAGAIMVAGPWALPALIALIAAKPLGMSGRDAGLQVKDVGSALACLMPIVLWAGWRLGGAWRAAGFAFQPLGVLALVAVGSKAGGAGILAAAIVASGCLAAHRRRLWIYALAVATVAAVASALAMQRPSRGDLGLPLEVIDRARQSIWRFAWSYVDQAPLFGHGIDTSNHLPGAANLVPGTPFAYITAHPHNWALEVLVDSGATGLAALIGVLTVLAIRLARLEPASATAGLALMASFWTSSLVNFSVWSAWWQWTFVILAAFVLAARSSAPSAETERSRPL